MTKLTKECVNSPAPNTFFSLRERDFFRLESNGDLYMKTGEASAVHLGDDYFNLTINPPPDERVIPVKAVHITYSF